MEKMNEKSCKNCLHKSNCLIRSATLYQLYIASDRSDELMLLYSVHLTYGDVYKNLYEYGGVV